MYDDFNFKACELEQEMTIEDIRDMLTQWTDVPGIFSVLGDRGARFIPDSLSMPAVYFAGDGKTIEVVTKDLDIDEVDDYLCRLARRLGCRILTEHLEYS